MRWCASGLDEPTHWIIACSKTVGWRLHEDVLALSQGPSVVVFPQASRSAETNLKDAPTDEDVTKTLSGLCATLVMSTWAARTFGAIDGLRHPRSLHGTLLPWKRV